MPVKQKIKEDAIERELVTRVRAMGGICAKAHVTGQRGFVDRLVILPGGRIILCECKRPRGGRLSIHQRQWIARCAALGVAIAVVRSAADIDALLK